MLPTAGLAENLLHVSWEFLLTIELLVPLTTYYIPNQRSYHSFFLHTENIWAIKKSRHKVSSLLGLLGCKEGSPALQLIKNLQLPHDFSFIMLDNLLMLLQRK